MRFLPIVFFLMLCLGPRPADAQNDLANLIDPYLSQLTEAGDFNGTVLVAHEGEIVFRKAYGYANHELGVEMLPEHKFRIGSVTKPFTATLIVKLAAEGRLALDDPLTRYLPYAPDSWGDDLHLRHLLSHTSGVPNYTESMEMMTRQIMLPETAKNFAKKYCMGELEFEPGSQYAYSNSNYHLLGLVIEKVTEKPFADALETYLLEPAGTTGTGVERTSTINPMQVAGYTLGGRELERARHMFVDHAYAAGAIYSTVDDLWRFHRALYAEELLPARWLDTMYRVVMNDYALGWTVHDLTGRRLVGHDGGIFGGASSFLRFPETNSAIIVLSNYDHLRVGNISAKLSQALFEGKAPKEAGKGVEVDPELFEEYVGRYALSPNFILTVSQEDGQLFVQATGQPRFPVFPSSESEFFLKVVEASVEFVRNEAGEVDALLLHQNGTQRAIRLKN